MKFTAKFYADSEELLSDTFGTATEAWRYLYSRFQVACPDDAPAYYRLAAAIDGEAFDGVALDGTGVIYGAPVEADAQGHDGYEFRVVAA